MPTPPKQPNVLLIWTDEQRADTLGRPSPRTPHLDRLAQGSCTFDRTYCVQPVCTPSRGSILTGLWPQQHGAWTNNQPLNADARTLAEHLPENYRKLYLGKWHLGDEIIEQHGWDRFISIEDGYRHHYTKPEYLARFSDYHHFLVDNGFWPDGVCDDGARAFSRRFAANLPYRFTKAGFLAAEASRALLAHDRSRPLCMSVNFLEPHMPFTGPWNDRYRPEEIETGPAFCIEPPADHAIRNRAKAYWYRQHGEGRPLKTEADFRRVRANYYGLTEMVDHAVGQILEALEQSGMADDTLVVFTSDHGDQMGDHALIAKGVMYEESTRVPMMLRAPWLGHGRRRVDGPFSHIDLLPTMLDLMGHDVPDLPGTSRRHHVETGDAFGDDVLIVWDGAAYNPSGTHVPGEDQAAVDAVKDQRWRTVVTPDGWKLNLCATDRTELFDLTTDPHEMTNLANHPAQRGRIDDLTARIRAWQRRVDDDAPLPA